MDDHPAAKDSKPLYEQIQNDIIQKIETGVYTDHQRIPSENELSRIYNVSRITATKALTELSLNGYVYRIQGKGSFVMAAEDRPVHAKKTSAGVKPYLVGLLVPSFGDGHGINLIHGITDVLSFPRFLVHILAPDSAQMEEYILQYFYQNHYDGILLFPNDFEFYSDTILQMHLKQYPFVLLDRIFQNLNCPYVACENQTGSEIAVDYLFQRGHTKIGFAAPISFQEQVTSLRHTGYMRAMSSRGLQARSYENLFQKFPQSSQYRLLNDITSGQLTALIASNSSCAVELFNSFQKHGIRVPEDVSIICFDNPCIFRSPSNFFTYIDQDSYNMGMAAGKIMRYLITKEGEAPALHQTTHPVIVENHSVQTFLAGSSLDRPPVQKDIDSFQKGGVYSFSAKHPEKESSP